MTSEPAELIAELEGRLAARTRELDAVNARLEEIVNRVQVGVIVFGSGGAIELANRPALEILGVNREELAELGERQSWRMFADDGRELELHDRPMFRALVARSETTAGRFAIERPDGVRLFVELSAVPLGPDDAEWVVVTIQDVTDRERRERAEREFVTNAAHELQTPIAAITSAVEVLQAGAKERPADRDRFLAHIERATNRLGRLTRALLVLALAQTRDEPPRTEVLALEPLLRSIADALANADVTVDCAPELAVIANRPLLEQAIVNLGENAAKHATRGVVLGGRRVDGRVAIDVRDEGPGIAAADRRRLFGRFVRGETSAPGFGLGLAIVREAVDALDGELVLDTGSLGTRVSIVLPGATVRKT